MLDLTGASAGYLLRLVEGTIVSGHPRDEVKRAVIREIQRLQAFEPPPPAERIAGAWRRP